MLRDREGTIGPVTVARLQRRLTGVDEMLVSLYAKALTTVEISVGSARSTGIGV